MTLELFQYSGQMGGFSGLTIGARHYAQGDAQRNFYSSVRLQFLLGVAVNATTLQVRL